MQKSDSVASTSAAASPADGDFADEIRSLAGDDHNTIMDADILYCCNCQKPTSEDTSLIVVRATKKQKEIQRCRKCHNLRARVNRICCKHGDLAEDWSSLSDQSKREFYQQCQDQAGEMLLLRMQETIVDCTRKSSSVTFEGTGKFIDEEDLDKKYKDKPTQLQAIKAHTRTMCCPVRKVKLYEDPEFTLTVADEDFRSEEKKRKAEFAHKAEPKKKTRRQQRQRQERLRRRS